MLRVAGGVISLRDESKRRDWEVALAPFELAAIPVTRALFAAARGRERPESAARPQVELSWHDAVRFCNLLSTQMGLTPCYRHPGDREGLDVLWDRSSSGFRLPTEAEWEYACRAGSAAPRYGELDDIAWHRGNSGGRLHSAGRLQPNAWGFHDMLGNVWEWCWDLYDTEVYGAYRVFRGGGWLDEPRGCRASCRRKSHPTFQIDDLGLRLARSIIAP